ncbi:hypothetical protein AAHH86_00060 [Candidatus Hodgkinia cicadicola]
MRLAIASLLNSTLRRSENTTLAQSGGLAPPLERTQQALFRSKDGRSLENLNSQKLFFNIAHFARQKTKTKPKTKTKTKSKPKQLNPILANIKNISCWASS